jgi:hypothetical protein
MVTQEDGATTEQLAEKICSLSAHMSAATCRWLLLIAEFDQREGWAADGVGSCAFWLSWRCGVAPRTSREQVRVAKKLTVLPLITERFASGELSYAKVRAVVRIATATTEQKLLEMALHMTAAQLEDMVRAHKASERAAMGKAAAQRVTQWVRTREHPDGSTIITIKAPPEDCALILDVMEEIVRVDQDLSDIAGESAHGSAEPQGDGVANGSAEPPGDGVANGSAEPDNVIKSSHWDQTRVAAFLAMARRARTTLDDDAILSLDRPQLLVHVGIDTIRANAGARHSEDHGPSGAFGFESACHLDHGPSLAFETVCRLGCESSVAMIVRGQDGNPLHLGRTTPAVNRAQRRALLVRDEGCRFPGCTNRRYLHAHHIVHWINGGATCISNLVLLCSRHHHLVHEGGFGVSGANGDVSFTRPDRTVIPANPLTEPVGASEGIVEQNIQLGLGITADTPSSLGNGERYDRGYLSEILWYMLHPELLTAANLAA